MMQFFGELYNVFPMNYAIIVQVFNYVQKNS